MATLFLFSIVTLFHSNVLTYPLVLVFTFVYYLSSNSMFFLQNVTSALVVLDEVSLFMVFMTAFVMFVSYMVALSFSQVASVSFVMVVIYFFCFMVFSVDSMFLMYVFYEASLLPILYIIIKWGSYPERSLSGLMLLIYTSVFTFPFLAVMFIYYTVNHSFCFSYLVLVPPYIEEPELYTLIVFATFAVKLPIYGLHFWLPMAHVEAPTFGSMILAGVLLNLGGVGLLRMGMLFDYSDLFSALFAYFVVAIVYVTVVCMFQADFKRLVAYSSVSHMIAVPFLVLANTSISAKALLMVMLFHGLSSPALFMLVGVIYSFYNTRQLVAVRGLLVLSPLVSFICVLAFFFTLSAPPFPSFVSEVLFIASSLYLSPKLVFMFLLFAFFSMVYNLNWLSSVLFASSASSMNQSFSLTFLSFLVLMSIMLLAGEILFLVSFM